MPKCDFCDDAAVETIHDNWHEADVTVCGFHAWAVEVEEYQPEVVVFLKRNFSDPLSMSSRLVSLSDAAVVREVDLAYAGLLH